MSDSQPYYVHPSALVETDQIGPGTRIWAFTHVMRDVTIGAQCNIGGHVFLESNVKLGNNVTVKNGVSIWEHVHLADNVFVGPNAVFTNDRYPRNPDSQWLAESTWVEEGVTIGANVTVRCGVRLGKLAFIGAGAVVTRDVAPHALMVGNPASRAGWVCACARPLVTDPAGQAQCQHCQRRYSIGAAGPASAS